MRNFLHQFNKAFESKVRLGIMSALMAQERLDFNNLKEILQVTDGNLASHLKALEKAGYLEVQKKFVGRKPNTSYLATQAGKDAFKAHLDALEQLLKNQ